MGAKKKTVEKVMEEEKSIWCRMSDLLEIEKKFVKSGCFLLDLALGGGFLRGSVVNIVGDESTGKTLLGVSVGVCGQKDGGYVMFDDCEGVLDIHRAVKVYGIDPDRAFYVQSRTVERLWGYLVKFCKFVKEKNSFGVYVLDSLDAVHTKMSVEAMEKVTLEMKSKGVDVEEVDLSMREKLDKSAMMSWLLSVIVGLLRDYDVLFVVISQTRERIGVVLGEKWDISGGKALKFYSSQRVYLKEVEKIREKDAVVGIEVEALVKKNKVAPPFRKVRFPILFDRGLDDVRACIMFLKAEGILESLRWGDKGFRSLREMVEYFKGNEGVLKELYDTVEKVWKEKYEI